MRAESLDIIGTVEELGMDGTICLGRCSRSTAYRDTKRINEYLEANKYDWRVRLVVDKSNKVFPYDLVVVNV